MKKLIEGPTNAAMSGRKTRHILALEDYLQFFNSLPKKIRDEVNTRWGPPKQDHFYLPRKKAFAISCCVWRGRHPTLWLRK
ncbi:MAG: cobaltochelatase subunit CobN, partial [Robiginitomaculum sp.]|nr:cobaltochelatase subunit CobN [Robiginitomaculum sp.]